MKNKQAAFDKIKNYEPKNPKVKITIHDPVRGIYHILMKIEAPNQKNFDEIIEYVRSIEEITDVDVLREDKAIQI